METLSKEEIVAGNKLIADFLGYEYVAYESGSKIKPGWWRKDTPAHVLNYSCASKLTRSYFLCRNHHALRYYNSWDALIPAMKKLNAIYVEQNISAVSKVYMYAKVAGEAMLRFDRPTCYIYVVYMIRELNKKMDQ